MNITKSQSTKINKMNTKSAKIRFLNAEGFSRSEIAALIKIRYQHVRNVLITPVKNPLK